VNIVDFLDEFQEACGEVETFKRSRAFMAAYLGLMETSLPQWARESLVLLDLFNRGKAMAEQVEEARVKCWKIFSVDSKKSVASETEKSVASALTCCLYAELPAGIDVPNLVSDFLREANKVEDHSAEIDSLIPRFFDGCASG
jgi:hypothetical protein